MNNAEEFYKKWITNKFGLTDKGEVYYDLLSKKTRYDLMEAYHQSRVNAISDDAQKAIDEFTRLQTKYPRMATVDVVEMLKRLIQDLKKLKQ